MTDKHIQDQISDINRKLDLLLEEHQLQRQRRIEVEDLVKDISIIGNDFVKSSVQELDSAGVELDGEALKSLGLKLVRNIGTINEMFEMLESASDLMKDVGPIIQQVGLDGIHKMGELEQKGYFAFFKEASLIVENIIDNFSTEDVKMLADNIVTILQTVKNLTQPDMMQTLNNALNVYKNLDPKNVEEVSMWKALRMMNTPEMKRGIGFMLTFLKNISQETNVSNN
ncbi:MAG: DUF1641 domain-containing protein [Bacteroidetes bacterium]|jgi:uncharacterized protein YjgD (DUF1641 family)|nr:DUF1641 domain-containing protein [Bacteroidota bacterium]MBT5529824.1 DUF1641 domain-containing protein [Cytophagia bacterium]MBT3422654.1 DUF1641 domain-containing protein [Bacteroidota bacterium]MBT3801401.1 DUF1641 domain-containing protein [Bacteroidota bacterium]MBT3934861.1 DUF1641 domain-containing protein [Bacteroidota bacterium]